jgi:hypothetical protein
MAPRDSRRVNRCGHAHWACNFPINVTVPVNIYSLAKNAGTSVNQIERFYAKRLPISRELMENLQSFGG